MQTEQARHWIEVRGTCQHCGGDAKCEPCGGTGCEYNEFGEAFKVCDDCGGNCVCAECLGGEETWLFFTAGTGKRGSCLRRDEILAFQHDGTLPSWWASYHGVVLV